MEDILKELGLEHFYKRFEEENITPNIVCKLSKYELQCLGLINSSDMMKLRVRCIHFGNQVPLKPDSSRIYDIQENILENLLDCGFTVKSISNMLSVSERTIYRRMTKYGLESCSFTDIENDDLDNVLEDVIFEFPGCGETMIRQLLANKGIKIARSRLRNALARVDNDGIQDRKKRRLHRRVYNVAAPNHVWHIDTNHKLIRWNFVIAGGIDGFSRFIVYLRCIDNNRAETIFSCFQSGLRDNGTPLKVRSDQGMENLKVAEYMISVHKSKSSMIVGKSTGNQRIERLWRNMFEGVILFFYDLFYFMEDQSILDPFNEMHIIALHYVYLQRINSNLSVWCDAWNKHRIRTVNSSPLKLFTAGAINVPIPQTTVDDIEGGFDYEAEQLVDHRPSLMPINNALSDPVVTRLIAECPPGSESVDYGIDTFERALNIIMSDN